MRNRSWLLLIILFCTLPVFAGDTAPTACPVAELEASRAAALGGSASQPVPAEKTLLYELARLPRGPIEIRYHVAGQVYVIESADLAQARPAQQDHPGAGLPKGAEVAPMAAGPEVIELLTLRPDIVRRLHRLAEGGSPIQVEILGGGVALDKLSFKEVLESSARLRARDATAVVLLSQVRGPGAELAPVPRPRSASGCGFCSPTSSCDDIGPYEPGKGDCVTCGEYGECDPGGCACSTVINEYWTSWFVTGLTYVGPWACVDYWYSPDSRALRARVTYRRNLVRVTRTCPNCPSCSGCYNTEQVIDYQVQTVYCYIDQYQSCQPGDFVIGTWELCG